ncbi:Type-2 restriction enzyme BsuMI component YdjA [compost metagenome]
MNKDDIWKNCYSESKEYDNDKYDALPEKIKRDGNIVIKKDDKFHFVLTGFLVCNGEMYVIFPKNHKIPEEYNELFDHIRTLAGVLLRYHREGTIEEEENDLFSSVNGRVPEGIAAALWLINDYIEYGFIRRSIVRQVHFGNNIDWSRTIKSTDPIISISGVSYVDPVYRKSAVDYNNMIYFLHRYAVQKSFQNFGWILGYDSYLVDPLMGEMPCDSEMAIHLLSRELGSTFNDRELNLFKTLIEFFEGSDRIDEKSKIDTFATKYFHNIWEAMCGFVFKNQYESLKAYIPRPIWHFNNGRTWFTHQRPDILFIEDRKMFILDAKYFNIPKSIPGWHDLVKQFFYAYSLKSKNKNTLTKIFNALILPDTVPEQIKYYGFVDLENNQDLGKVYAFVVDTHSLMVDYSNYRYSSWRQLIVTELIKNEIQ